MEPFESLEGLIVVSQHRLDVVLTRCLQLPRCRDDDLADILRLWRSPELPEVSAHELWVLRILRDLCVDDLLMKASPHLLV